MNRFFKNVALAAAAGCLLLTTSCAMAAAPVNGFWYSEVAHPGHATDNATSSKMGKAECTSILGLVATGDASISAAARAGGITKIHHVDYDSYSILGIYAKFTTIVYGD